MAYRHGVDDFWELGVSLAAGAELGGGYTEHPVAHALFESRCLLDAFSWVPYFSFGLGALLRDESEWRDRRGPEVAVTGHAGIGIEWRPTRSWSVGFAVRYHATLTDLAHAVGPIGFNLSASWYPD